MFCKECGTKYPDEGKFCPTCGTINSRQKIAEDNPPPQIQNQTQPQPQIQQTQAREISKPEKPGKKKKSSGFKALIITIPVLVVLIAGGLGFYFLVLNKTDPGKSISAGAEIDLPFVSYTYQDKKPEAVIEFTAVDSVFPSNYRMMDSLVTFTGYSDYGDVDVLIEVEVPGFTQLYKQKVLLGRQVTKLRIIPPLITGTLDLDTEKTAQLVYSVTEVETGKLLIQESKNIKLFSKFDMMWGDWETDEVSSWYMYADSMLAWITPDAPEILSLKRDAVDYLIDITDGELDSLVGYQNYNYFESYYSNTWVQALAIQGAMSDNVKVRYNNSGFSMDAQQRVKLPADTLNARSGICIETSLVMASALQSAGMHVMLLIPPGHAQVAVEAWPGTGDYYLIETTVLPMERDNITWNNTVQYLDKDTWLGYITGEGEYTIGPCYVLDCDLGEKLGIRAMSN